MKLFNIKNILSTTIVVLGFAACTNDLTVENINPQQVPDVNEDALFTKIYANMVTTGQTGLMAMAILTILMKVHQALFVSCGTLMS